MIEYVVVGKRSKPSFKRDRNWILFDGRLPVAVNHAAWSVPGHIKNICNPSSDCRVMGN